MSEKQGSLIESPNATLQTPIVSDDYRKWSANEVVTWCLSSLDISKDDPLVEQVLSNDIRGELLPELSFDDCKELCESDINKAIRLKVSLNKLQHHGDADSKMQEQQENMVVALKNLYSTISQRLQDFQSQYSRLRVDVLEIVKNSNVNSNVSPKAALQHTAHQIQTPGDYFDGSHHLGDSLGTHVAVPTPLPSAISRKASSLSKPSVSRSTSSNINSEGAGIPTTASNEPLKQLRASKEDSCERILKNAMKRHNLSDQDWRQYVLVICYGDQERVLDLEEKPVVIFKNLKQQGMHPAIMLRRRGDFEELSMGGENVTPGGRL